jgi:hypothetical protein
VLRPRERVSSHCFLGNLRHPDITVHLLQINEDFIVGDAEIRSAEEGGGATSRVVEVLKSERLSQRMFGCRIQALGPDAKTSIACRGEIHGVAVRRELRLIVIVPSVSHRNPFRFRGGGQAIPHRRDQNLSIPESPGGIFLKTTQRSSQEKNA